MAKHLLFPKNNNDLVPPVPEADKPPAPIAADTGGTASASPPVVLTENAAAPATTAPAPTAMPEQTNSEARQPLKRRLGLIALITGVSLIVLLLLGGGGLWLYRYTREPAITLLGNGEETIEVFAHFEDAGAKAVVNGKDISRLWEVQGRVDPATPGDYTLKYIMQYHRHSYTLVRHIRVADTTAPVLTLSGEAEMTISAMHLYQEPGYQAQDNYDGMLTERVKITQGEVDANGSAVITYFVSDAAGNTAQAQRIIHIHDTTPPVITLTGADLTIGAGGAYRELGVAATDDADGDISDRITVDGAVNVGVPGTYTLHYTVSDAAGNIAQAIRTVTVIARPADHANRIYFTFDDGPSAHVTGQVLDTLLHYGVRATFFVVNFSDDKIPLLQRMILEGHTVALHAYSHDYAGIYASDQAFMDNLYRLQNRIADAIGIRPCLMRFPGGSSNTVSAAYSDGIMSRLTAQVEREGFSYFDWNVSSGDASGNHIPTQTITDSVLNGIQPNRANVVLMHDTDAKTTTLEALPAIIEAAMAAGYVFLPLTNDTPPVHHGVNN